MNIQHRAKPRLLGGRLLRFAWSATGLVPKRLRRGNFLGKWRTTVSEWAWVHHKTCQCQGCGGRAYLSNELNKAYSVAHKGYLHAKGFVTADEVLSAYNAAFQYGSD